MKFATKLQTVNLNPLMTQLFYIALMSLLLSSCSNRQMYNAVQSNRQIECQRLPAVQYDECMNELDESYDSYEKKREEIGEANSQGAS